MNKKTCPKCGEDKPTTEFYKNKRRRDGLQSHCKQCHNELTKSSYENRHGYYLEAKKKANQAHRAKNRELVQEEKSKPCADCGRSYPYYVMDFDHVRGKKAFTIGASMSKPARVLREEIKKCDVVCANCHRIRTHKRKNMLP